MQRSPNLSLKLSPNTFLKLSPTPSLKRCFSPSRAPPNHPPRFPDVPDGGCQVGVPKSSTLNHRTLKCEGHARRCGRQVVVPGKRGTADLTKLSRAELRIELLALRESEVPRADTYIHTYKDS